MKHSSKPRDSKHVTLKRQASAPMRDPEIGNAQEFEEESVQRLFAGSQTINQGTLPTLQRSMGNRAVMRMLGDQSRLAQIAPGQLAIQRQAQAAPARADTQAAATQYNQGRFSYDPQLVEQLHQVAQNRELYEAARASRAVGAEFTQLVLAAQNVLFPGAENDGKLGPATLRAVLERAGQASTAIGLGNRQVPERQVYSGRDPVGPRTFNTTRTGQFIVTGGFMEPNGHAQKPAANAIFSNDPDNITPLRPSGRNLGIDYVVQSRGKDVNAWYGGLVTRAGLDGGYGYRITVETDVTYRHNGRDYVVYQAYGHNSRLNVRQGTVIAPGANIATMGGTGRGGAVRYAEHVDLRTWIMVDGRMIDVAPNLVDQQLAQRRGTGGTQAGGRQPGTGQSPDGQARNPQAPRGGQQGPGNATPPRGTAPQGGQQGGATPSAPRANRGAGIATVTASVLRVRQGPSRRSPIIGRLRRSQSVQLIAREGEWLRIRHRNQEAFIHGDYATVRPARQQNSGPGQAPPRQAPAGPQNTGPRQAPPRQAPAGPQIGAPQQAPPTQAPAGPQNEALFESGRLTMEGEGLGPETLTIHWPAGASGVTIGYGYDMKERSAENVIADLTAAGISRDNATALAGGAGLEGAAAQRWVAANRRQPWATITSEQRAALFRQLFPAYRARARNLATDRTPTRGSARVNAASRDPQTLQYVIPRERWDALHPGVIELLTDMTYSGAYSYSRHETINPILMDERLTPVEQLQQIRPIIEGLPRAAQARERRRLRLQFIDNLITRLQAQRDQGARR